ncbi:MAG TPA: HlyD family efflux transporter periplasmic adaptor subunit [Burkholderiales bacterium]|nr:HlyD family efflux transporter periplasmic adaptor subunit [Burkholderiales bacterium]
MQDIIQAWLDQQCAQIKVATGAVVLVLARNSTALVPAAHWPAHTQPGAELANAATAAYERQEALSQPRMNGAERPLPLGPMISCPIEVKGRTIGAVAIAFDANLTLPPPAVVDSVMREAQGFESYMRQSSPGKTAKPGTPSTTSTGFVPNDMTSTQPRPRSSALIPDPTRTVPGPMTVTSPLPAMPAGAIATPPVPTLHNEVNPSRGAELPASNSARILQLLATVEAHERFDEAAAAFATELALLFNCDRVSVGLSGRRHVKVEALSHATEFRSNQSLLRDIGAAMEEAIWQGVTLTHPLPEGAQPRVDRAHTDLAQRHGSGWISTVLLVKAGKACGAITLERNRAEGLSRADLTLCENIGALLGPLLEVRRTVGKPWPAKIAGALREAASPLFGAGHLALKVGVGAIVAVLAGAAFIQGDYRVSAPARLEGAVQRVMVAPAEGYLKLAHVRPGDRVKEGQVVAELSDEDLKLEERKAQSELSQIENSYGTALVKQDRAEVAILGAKLEEARAQLALVQTRLQRTQVVAPFDGIVITGDLTQSLGAPVKKGESLMTLAPEHNFRVILEVDERDIADVKLGKAGSLALSALPSDTFPLEVNRITPVATSGQGRNYFEVEAQMKGKAGELRPGLLGVGKVEAGERSLLWIWTHRVSDWLRLAVWSWLG